jgi:hypothetical protein
VASTETACPYSAWVWVRLPDVRPIFCAVVIDANQSSMRTGFVRAGWSTGRGLSGELQTVATATSTNATGGDGVAMVG